MKRLLHPEICITCFLLLAACQVKNEKPLNGEWRWFNHTKRDYYDSLYNPPPLSDMRYDFPGLRFLSDDSLENPMGFFDYKILDTSEDTEKPASIYLGQKTAFKRTGNSLLIYDRSENKWKPYTVVRQNTDTLIFKDKKGYLAWYVNTTAQPKYDAISIASSGCFGSCPATKLFFFSDGRVRSYAESYTNQLGFLETKIDTALYQDIVSRFNKLPISQLKARYAASATDHNTVTVSFVQNGQIVKTISDYGREAPAQFVWAYQYALNTSTMFGFKPFKPQFSPVLSGYLEDLSGNKPRTLRLYESEAFLFWYYLDKAKPITPSQKKLPYKFHFSTNSYFLVGLPQESLKIKIPNNQPGDTKGINTDGRFVEFDISPNKKVWMDMGFNVIDHSRILRWRFINDYSSTESYFIIENY